MDKSGQTIDSLPKMIQSTFGLNICHDITQHWWVALADIYRLSIAIVLVGYGLGM